MINNNKLSIHVHIYVYRIIKNAHHLQDKYKGQPYIVLEIQNDEITSQSAWPFSQQM